MCSQTNQRVLDQRMGGIGTVAGVSQHLHAILIGVGAAVLVDGFRNAKQHIAGDGQSVRNGKVGMDGGIKSIEQLETVWIGDYFVHQITMQCWVPPGRFHT